jgi:predicted dehydrogenase
MAEPVRIGLIGTSWWMDMSHLPMLKADPRVEMVAICGRNRERAQ